MRLGSTDLLAATVTTAPALNTPEVEILLSPPPTSMPSSNPSSSKPSNKPTPSPTKVTCQAGSFAADDVTCQPCPPGSSQANPGSQSCNLCIAGTYSGGGLAQCTTCPFGRITPNPGGITEAECLNVAPNFATGIVVLFFASVILGGFMFGYVYQETSRRGKRNRGSLMNVSSRLVGCAVLKKLEKSALEASRAKKNEEESMGLQEAPTVTRFHRILRLFYVIFAVIAMILIVILPIAVVQFFTILRIFYGSIIMWRGTFKFQVFLTLIQNICDFRLCSFCC